MKEVNKIINRLNTQIRTELEELATKENEEDKVRMKLSKYQKIVAYLELIRFTDFNPEEKEKEMEEIRVYIQTTLEKYF